MAIEEDGAAAVPVDLSLIKIPPLPHFFIIIII